MCYCSALGKVSLAQVCPLCHSRGELTQEKSVLLGSALVWAALKGEEGRRDTITWLGLTKQPDCSSKIGGMGSSERGQL